ncbi:hypothetical protein P175DRAFT_0504389 [Aspergillus ochraceoroseus IBT 24754]|uniref:Fungal specific transcription factor domain-containing protein n=1 Tax=Aspergillus ochraceoroseus IBT 24754 TaxID=1392256 RepID=A0A2T5LMY9_9EURO|nr:uncharacterized protein P175DRAFT_0504389 [Aspergillus ochraceoroseus IBT 24754]PTU17649.1 hypothetical protein P175DRAFT_0504389 [Aspergillus ochraceoroseus IBT 24754]
MSLTTLTRTTTTLLHLLLSLPLRASTTSSTPPLALALSLSQSPTRSFSSTSTLLQQCPATNLSPHSFPSSSNTTATANTYSTMSQPTQEPPTPNPEPRDAENQKPTQEPPLLALPSAEEPANFKLDLSSGDSTVKLDHLGPLVVNQDGTLSRIGNWAQMTELEKKNTLRVLGKRNKARLEALKASQAGED